MQATNEYLTTSQLAERFQTPESTVRYWRHTGYGPPGVKIGRRVLYRVADVQEWERAIRRDAAGGAR